MIVRPFRGEAAEVLTFTDAGVVPDPTVVQLDRLRGRGFASAEPVGQMVVPVIDFGEAG